MAQPKKALVVCGPTASGKSDLADRIADAVSETLGGRARTVVVDSMQVYRELPAITNQARRRPADLVGVASVTDEWTVARHREAVDRIILNTDLPFVLDAGTGMYLNATILDIPLAPKVPEGVRKAAVRSVAGAENERRAARARELAMIGAPERGSIWDGAPLYETDVTYLRPPRAKLDAAIRRRSERIVREGGPDALAVVSLLDAGERINPSVLGAIGVREMVGLVRGETDEETAVEEMAARTRRLARRQMRWFDKLVRKLRGRARVEVVGSAAEAGVLRSIHDIIRA